jgi:hypothetical protein
MKPCPSEFTIERWRQGELGAAPRSEVVAADDIATHVGACVSCATRVKDLAAPPPPMDLDAIWNAARAVGEPDDEPRPAMPVTGAGRAGFRTWSRRRLTAVFLPLAAAAAMTVAWWPSTSPDVPKGRGEWALRVLVKVHGRETIAEATSGVRLAAGDRLRFETWTNWPRGYVALIGLDAAGVVSAWAPTEGPTVEVPGGRHFLMDSAIELDDTLGPERVELIGCRQPRQTSALVADARRALERAHGDLRALGPFAAGCHQQTFWIDKVKP